MKVMYLILCINCAQGCSNSQKVSKRCHYFTTSFLLLLTLFFLKAPNCEGKIRRTNSNIDEKLKKSMPIYAKKRLVFLNNDKNSKSILNCLHRGEAELRTSCDTQ